MKVLIVLSILGILSVNLFSNMNEEGTPIVIKSDIGKYFILEKNLKVNSNKDLRSIVTKRVGSSELHIQKDYMIVKIILLNI